jgi:hypothetical protein
VSPSAGCTGNPKISGPRDHAASEKPGGGSGAWRGIALREAGRVDEAVTACQDAAALYHQTSDRHREGNALSTESGAPGHGLGLANAALNFSDVLTPRMRAVCLRQRANAHALLSERRDFEEPLRKPFKRRHKELPRMTLTWRSIAPRRMSRWKPGCRGFC